LAVGQECSPCPGVRLHVIRRPRRLSGQGWPELGLERQYRSGSPQTSMRSGSTLTVACQVSVRPRPRRSCGPAGRCSIATSSPGEPASTSSSGSPILLRPAGNGCGPSSRRTRTWLRFASSVTSTATRSPCAAQAQRLIADGGKLLLSVRRRRTSNHWEQPDMPRFGRCPSPLPGGERSRTPRDRSSLARSPPPPVPAAAMGGV
jgi:hypothetical protein